MRNRVHCPSKLGLPLSDAMAVKNQGHQAFDPAHVVTSGEYDDALAS